MDNITNITNSTGQANELEVPMSYAVSYGIVFPAIVIIGLVGNMFTLIVVCRENTSLSIKWLILSLSISDIFVLLSRLSFVLLRIFQIYLPQQTKEISRYLPSYALLIITNYFQKISKMILVQIGMERIMAVWFPLKIRLFCSEKRTPVIILSLVLLVSFIHIPCLVDIFINHTSIISQGGEIYTGMPATIKEIQRYNRKIGQEHTTLFLLSRYLLDFFPLFFLTISSIIIVIGVKRSTLKIRKQGKKNQMKQVTKMLVSICIIFVVLCLPSDFLSVALYTYGVIIPSAYYILFDIMTTTNNAINFVFYCAFHKTYREQYKRLVMCKKS